MLSLLNDFNGFDIFPFTDRIQQPMKASRSLIPSSDVIENTDEIIVRLEVPGISSDDITVNVEKDVLTVSGEKKDINESKLYHRSEIRYGSFKRTFSLPAHINQNKIEAAYKDGILSIHLPKAEIAKPKAIPVKTI